MSEVKRYQAVHIRYEENNIRYGEGCEVDMVTASDFDKQAQEIERLRMQLAACGVVAMANTPGSATKARDMHPDYMSASCTDVIRVVDSEMRLRDELQQLKSRQSGVVLPERKCWKRPLPPTDFERGHDYALDEVDRLNPAEQLNKAQVEYAMQSISAEARKVLEGIERLMPGSGPDFKRTPDELKEAFAALPPYDEKIVAWMYTREGKREVQQPDRHLDQVRLGLHFGRGNDAGPREDYTDWTPLYTAPPSIPETSAVVERDLQPVLAMILNALDRDAAEGKSVRGEMADELRAILSSKGGDV